MRYKGSYEIPHRILERLPDCPTGENKDAPRGALTPLRAMTHVLEYLHGQFIEARDSGDEELALKYGKEVTSAAQRMAPYMHATYQAIALDDKRDKKQKVVLNFAPASSSLKEIVKDANNARPVGTYRTLDA